MKKSTTLFVIWLISTISFGQSKNVKPLVYQQYRTWSVTNLVKLAESKGTSELYGIVNPSQILYVDTMQVSKLIRLERKENPNFKKSYEYEQYKKVLVEAKYLSWNTSNLISLNKEYTNAESLVVNNRNSFISALSKIYSAGDTFLIVIYDKDRVYFRIEHPGLGEADAYLGIIKGNKLKLYCVWSIVI
jgi:hypothetical protein